MYARAAECELSVRCTESLAIKVGGAMVRLLWPWNGHGAEAARGLRAGNGAVAAWGSAGWQWRRGVLGPGAGNGSMAAWVAADRLHGI